MKYLPLSLTLMCVLASFAAGCKKHKQATYTYATPRLQSVGQGGVPTAHAAPQDSSQTPAGDAVAQAGLAQQSDAALERKLRNDAAQFKVLAWDPPPYWEHQPLGLMRKGHWKITREKSTAQVTVLAFPGDVGGGLANVNRWAQQIGMSPLGADELKLALRPIEVSQHQAHWLLLTEPHREQAVIAAIVPTAKGTWFFKVMGHRDCVLAEQDAFCHFLTTVKLAP